MVKSYDIYLALVASSANSNTSMDIVGNHKKKRKCRKIALCRFFYYAYSNIYGCTWNYAGFMEYPVKLLPIFPPMAPWDSTVMPVTTMIFLQYKTEINPF